MIKLSDHNTVLPAWDKKNQKKAIKDTLKQIGALQYQMFAEKKHSLLLVFQGLDASGKDGLVNKLLKYCNPVAVSIVSFKKPTPEEYAHDFLWRIHQHSPQKGCVQIFIRSHYEDILVPGVEGFLPAELIEERYKLINQFEQLLQHNGSSILKFFLHVSPEEQERRLRERLVVREKNWKHNDGDWETREKFDQYMAVYEKIINRCNVVPWHVVPADKNSQKLSVVANNVLNALKSMNLTWPELETELPDINNPA